jgi:hypothetical protein
MNLTLYVQQCQDNSTIATVTRWSLSPSAGWWGDSGFTTFLVPASPPSVPVLWRTLSKLADRLGSLEKPKKQAARHTKQPHAAQCSVQCIMNEVRVVSF